VAGRDISGIALHLQPGLTISGRVQFERSGNMPAPDISKVKVTASPLAGSSPMDIMNSFLMGPDSSAIGADNTFTIKGLAPDKYRVAVTMPGLMLTQNAAASSWVLKSAMLNGRDVSDLPLDLRSDTPGLVVTMTDTPTELAGGIFDQLGRRSGGFQLLVVSTNRAYWTAGSRRIARVRSASDGSYRVVGLPAGEYYVCVLTDLETSQLSDPTFLESVAQASITVKLADGQKTTRDIRLAGG
jgi:hypothetical protein